MAPSLASARVDRWLWSVRVFKTRPDAAAACRGGHVRINDVSAKPSATVVVGDLVAAWTGSDSGERLLEVTRVIERRVGAPVATECYLDRTPKALVNERDSGLVAVRGEGRPTKKDRRELDRLRKR